MAFHKTDKKRTTINRCNLRLLTYAVLSAGAQHCALGFPFDDTVINHLFTKNQ